MPQLPSPKVLILAQNPDSARRWAELLPDSAAEVWQSRGDVPPLSEVEVVVTDLPSREIAAEQGGLSLQHAASDSARTASTGTIGIGPCEGADVILPVDCSGRELSLTCTLLAEIVRLRRRQADAATQRQEFDQLAYLDALTGLANRRAWDRQFPAKYESAQSAGTELWLAIVDLDHFKEINDARGLLAGDDILRGAAQALAAQLRRDDLIARLGGDEFALLLLGIDESGVCGVFDRLREAVREQPILPGARPLAASIGYATPRAEQAATSDWRDLFIAAERGLRHAKAAGGDRACRGEVTRPSAGASSRPPADVE